ncbi:MAG: hypothetical protein QOI49_1090 [Verrucomicrobiota bacterium]
MFHLLLPFRSLSLSLSLVLLPSVFAATSSDPEAMAPIEIHGSTTTNRDLLQQHLLWAERVLVQPFSARVQKEPYHDQAVAFVRDALPSLLMTSSYYPTSQTLAAAQSLRDAGCDDPLVRLLDYRVVFAVKGFHGNCFVELAHAMETAFKWPGPKALAWILARQRACLAENDPEKDRSGWMAVLLTPIVMSDGSYRADEDRLFYQHLFTPQASELIERSYESFAVLEGQPVLGDWLQNTMHGWFELQRADDKHKLINGEHVEAKGESAEVHMDRAREAFTRAWNLRPDRPEPATQMINASRFTDEATCRLWFDRAIAAQFDYLPAYRTFLWALRPRFAGSAETMIAFGTRCMETNRYDTGIPEIFLDAATDAATDIGDWRKIYRDPEIARKTVEVSRKFAERAVGTSRERMWLEFLALNSWLAGDFTTAGQARAKLTGPLSRQVAYKASILGVSDFVEQLTRDLAAGSGEFQRAEKLAEKEEYAAARVAYQKALTVATVADQPRVRQRIGLMEFKEKAASADWVPLPPPDSTTPMWFQLRANGGRQVRELTPEEEVIFAAKYDHPPAGLCFAASPGDDFEVRWELPAAAADPETVAACRLMLQLVPADTMFPYNPPNIPLDGVANWFSVRIKPGAARGTVDVTVLDFGGEQGSDTFTVPAKARSRVTFRLSNESMSLALNDQPVFEGTTRQRVYGWPQVLIAFAAPPNPAERPEAIAVRIPSKSDREEVAQVNP